MNPKYKFGDKLKTKDGDTIIITAIYTAKGKVWYIGKDVHVSYKEEDLTLIEDNNNDT